MCSPIIVILQRDQTGLRQDFRNPPDLGSDYPGSTPRSLQDNQRESFVTARQHQDIGASEYLRHLLPWDITPETAADRGIFQDSLLQILPEHTIADDPED